MDMPSAAPDVELPSMTLMSTWPRQIYCAMAEAARHARNVMPPRHKTYCQVESRFSQRLMSFAHPFVSWMLSTVTASLASDRMSRPA